MSLMEVSVLFQVYDHKPKYTANIGTEWKGWRSSKSIEFILLGQQPKSIKFHSNLSHRQLLRYLNQSAERYCHPKSH